MCHAQFRRPRNPWYKTPRISPGEDCLSMAYITPVSHESFSGVLMVEKSEEGRDSQ